MKKIHILLFIIILVGGCKTKPGDDTEKKINDLIGKMTLEEKIDMIGGYEDFNIKPLARLGIPMVRMADGPCGVRNYGPSTAYPAPVNTAASWDTAVAAAVGRSTADEALAKDVQIMLAPGMNIYRAPMCGRNFEYLGEDPYLAGHMAAAYIKGMQNQGVMATAKHYDANNQEYDRHNVSSDMDERTLHEIYLPAFKTAVEEGQAACLMTSYNLVNGVHASQNDELINQILKKDWNFRGIVMSDWVSTYNGVAAANAGLDLEMPSGVHMCRDTLLAAVKDGRVKERTIDDKIRRMLRMFYRFNLMDSAKIHMKHNVDLANAARVALEAARGGITLLKNENSLLPLETNKIKSIAVLGPNAETAITGGGGSSFVNPIQSVSVLQGIKDLAGNTIKVSFSSGPFETITDDFYKQTIFDDQNLQGEYFTNKNLEGSPAAKRADKIIDFDWNANNRPQGIPEYNFSVRWKGSFRAPASGKYKIAVSGDDGYRLTFDHKLMIDQWHDQGENTQKTLVALQGGRTYPIVLEYYQSGGNGAIRFGIQQETGNKMEEALNLARQSDVVVLCAGFNNNSEGEGSDRSYGLPDGQEDFIRYIAAVNKNTIVVLNAGGNAGIANWINPVGALLHAWYPGEMGGQAIAEILFGKVNPSGKLPFSIEKRWEDAATFNSYYDDDKNKKVTYSEGIFLGYRHFDTKNIEPLFPFGFGLSYTTFEYKNLKISPVEFNANDTVLVSVDITNTGKVEGKEVVELYISDPVSSLPRPLKELKAFAKVGVAPGETKTVTMKLGKSAFSFYDPAIHQWKAEPGEFDIEVGASSGDLRLKKAITLK